MTTIIFKSEKKAKVYEIKAAVSFGVYTKGQLIGRVKTDNIDLLNEDYYSGQLEIKEILCQ